MNNDLAIEAIVEAAMQVCADDQRRSAAALRVREAAQPARTEDPFEATLAAWRQRHGHPHDPAEVLICAKC